MRFHRWLYLLLLAGIPVLAPATGWAQSAVITIDFDTFPGPDGMLGTADDVPAPDCPDAGGIGICDIIGDAYASLGVTFAPVLLFQGSFFPDKEPTNHFLSSEPMDARFTFDVYQASLSSYSVWPAVLYGLDADDNIVATSFLPNDTHTFQLGVMSISSTEPIRRVTALAEGCVVGEFCDQILNVDDLVLDLTPIAAPTIPTLSGVGIAVLGLLLLLAGFWFLPRR